MCIAGDTIGLEVLPSEEENVFLPVHAYMFATAGAQIIEVVDMNEIAAEKQYEFAFLGLPLKLRGATGAPMPSVRGAAAEADRRLVAVTPGAVASWPSPVVRQRGYGAAEGAHVALEGLLRSATALDLVLEPPDLRLHPSPSSCLASRGLVADRHPVAVLLAQGLPDTGHVVRAHAREGVRVDPVAFLLEDDLPELRPERFFPLLLERQRLERLPARRPSRAIALRSTAQG